VGIYTFDRDQQLTPARNYGLRGGYNFTDSLALEAISAMSHGDQFTSVR